MAAEKCSEAPRPLPGEASASTTPPTGQTPPPPALPEEPRRRSATPTHCAEGRQGAETPPLNAETACLLTGSSPRPGPAARSALNSSSRPTPGLRPEPQSHFCCRRRHRSPALLTNWMMDWTPGRGSRKCARFLQRTHGSINIPSDRLPEGEPHRQAPPARSARRRARPLGARPLGPCPPEG